MSGDDNVLRFPDPREAKARIYRDASEIQRKALLYSHTNWTLEKALRVLQNPWSWAARVDALEILIEAAPRYERLGGDLDPWRQRPADWEALATAQPWEVKR